jgi:acetyl esterase/lipase
MPNRDKAGLEMDDATWWATVAATEFIVFPDHVREPRARGSIVYGRAGNIELELNIVTAGPETRTRPTMIFIHGGGWVLLRKEDRFMNLLPYLARGMNGVNLEYRLAHQALAPAAVEDCRCALRWVWQNAAQYGIDTSKLVIGGESAGGHLALMTGMLQPSDGFDTVEAYSFKEQQQPVGVSAIINYFGITDVGDLLDGANRREWAVQWLGNQPDRMELARRVSPLTYARKACPPVLTIHGTNDGAVPYDHAVRLHRALDLVEVPNRLVTILEGGHGQSEFTRAQNLLAQAEVFRFLEEQRILEYSSGDRPVRSSARAAS